jgi:hypothetical protein
MALPDHCGTQCSAACGTVKIPEHLSRSIPEYNYGHSLCTRAAGRAATGRRHEHAARGAAPRHSAATGWCAAGVRVTGARIYPLHSAPAYGRECAGRPGPLTLLGPTASRMAALPRKAAIRDRGLRVPAAPRPPVVNRSASADARARTNRETPAAGDQTLGGTPTPVILATISGLDSGRRPAMARITPPKTELAGSVSPVATTSTRMLTLTASAGARAGLSQPR